MRFVVDHIVIMWRIPVLQYVHSDTFNINSHLVSKYRLNEPNNVSCLTESCNKTTAQKDYNTQFSKNNSTFTYATT